jgi:hypothetical protein
MEFEWLSTMPSAAQQYLINQGGIMPPLRIALALPSVSAHTGTPGPGCYWAQSGARSLLTAELN